MTRRSDGLCSLYIRSHLQQFSNLVMTLSVASNVSVAMTSGESLAPWSQRTQQSVRGFLSFMSILIIVLITSVYNTVRGPNERL